MEAKRVYRLPPCPAYDIAATQTWLEQLSREGLQLERFTAGVGVFNRRDSAQTRYRLDAYTPSENPLDETGPAKQAVAMAQEFGWDYVCLRGAFAIYRTDDAAAPELHTDHKLQALSLRTLEKQTHRFIAQLVFWSLLALLFTRAGGLLLLSIHAGLWLTAILLVALIGGSLRLIYKLFHLRRTRKALQKGILPTASLSRKKQGILYQTGRCLLLFVLVTLAAVYLIHWKTGGIDRAEARIPLEDFPGRVPFATAADLAPEGAALSHWVSHASRFRKDLNTFARWNGLLAADAIRWEEFRTATPPGGEAQNIWIKVNYYELQSEWLAKWLFRELSQRSLAARVALSEPVALPDLPVDEALLKENTDSCLLRKGRQVLFVKLYDYSDLTMEDCVPVFAQSLQ